MLESSPGDVPNKRVLDIVDPERRISVDPEKEISVASPAQHKENEDRPQKQFYPIPA